MAVYLVRHAVAQSRSDYGDGDDDLRPLTKRGERQAARLTDMLAEADVRRNFSSPAVRCVNTVAPLARKLGLEVRTVAALVEGSGGRGAYDLVRDCARRKGDSVLCTHGDIVPEVLRRIARDGAALPDELRWAKGSTWILETDGDHVIKATYVAPPE
jgi:phosphohistidine phosphatase SixA